MASTSSSDTGGWGFGFSDILGAVDKLANYAIDYERAKAIDTEPENSTPNIPDTVDLKTGQGQLGGGAGADGIVRTYGGMTPGQWGAVGGISLVAVLAVLAFR